MMFLKKRLLFLSIFLVIIFLLFFEVRIEGAEDFAAIEFKELSKKDFQTLSAQEQNQYVEKLTKEKGPEQTWGFIKKTFSANQSPQQAHDLAHLTGGLIYQKNQFQGLSTCSPEFAFGCYHGFLDQAFLNGTENLTLAEEACQKIGTPNTGPVASCIHGIGHGLASFYKMKNLEGSLKECNRLKSGSQFCYDGVFMEYERSAIPNFYNITDPLYPCNNLDEVLTISCGRNQPQVMMQRFRFDFNKTVATCSQTENLKLKEACFDSLGFYTVSASKADPLQIISLCSQPQVEGFKQRCLKAAAGELVFQNIPNWKDSTQKVCSAQESGEAHQECLQYTQQLAQEYQRN